MNNEYKLEEVSKLIRKDIVSMLTESASGHPGGSLSVADIMTVLFFKEMNIDPSKVQMILIEIDLFYQKVMQHQYYIVL